MAISDLHVEVIRTTTVAIQHTLFQPHMNVYFLLSYEYPKTPCVKTTAKPPYP